MEISGAVAVVTGGTGRIGQAITSELERRGAVGVRWDRTFDAGLDRAIECDVSEAQSVEDAMQQTIEQWGMPRILVNGAAVSGALSPLAAAATGEDWGRVLSSLDDWRRVIDINLIGVVNCMRSFARRIASAGSSGSIVNISSIASLPHAEPGYTAYAASKAALNQLTICAADDFGPIGIQVNAVAPGMMSTGMRDPNTPVRPNDGVPPSAARVDIMKHVPLGQRLGQGTDIAQAACALIELDYVTGQTVYVDGGLSLRTLTRA